MELKLRCSLLVEKIGVKELAVIEEEFANLRLFNDIQCFSILTILNVALD